VQRERVTIPASDKAEMGFEDTTYLLSVHWGERENTGTATSRLLGVSYTHPFLAPGTHGVGYHKRVLYKLSTTESGSRTAWG